jgi:hypothetical protein
MTFKVGDRVVGNGNGFSHRIGDIGTIVGLSKIQTHILWDDTDLAAYVNIGGIDLAPPIGKPITELNLQVGDVVIATDGDFAQYGEFTVTRISDHPMFEGWAKLHNPEYGFGHFGGQNSLWQIVPRAADAKPPRKMHPDDFVNAVMEFAAYNGFALNSLKYHTPLGATYMWSMINQPPAN